ncbi:MAG: FAD-dependent oxidoreductase [Cyanobacteriota bacterium]|nr:FAD-dependent oxidoreductase [Cyanobacteriota bacterium]
MSAPVVIVGGGFGGLYTALALAGRRDHPPLLLIEPNERFLFLPLLYELLSGELRSWEIAPRYDALLAGRGVAWLRERVQSIDAEARTLQTAGGRRVAFSRLVVATGGDSESFGIAGVMEHALFFRSLGDVERLQQRLAALRQRRRSLQRIAIVGAGPSGVELACKLADLLEGSAVVELIEQGPSALPQARAFNREQALVALRRRDVRLRTGLGVTAVQPGQLELSDGTSLAVDTTVWTAGLRLNPPPIQPAPARDSRGRLLCTPELQLRQHPHLFAVGDVAALPDEPLPATAQVAFQQAECLAANLMRAAAGEQLQPFAFNDLGEMLSLGVGEATVTGMGITLAGSAAFQLRRLAYLTRLPGTPHQLRVAAGWLADWGR